MDKNYFSSGMVRVGNKDVPFEKRNIQGNFTMYMPVEFLEDKNLVSNYTYLFSKDKSPLSVAIKYSAVTSAADKEKMIAHYFSHAAETRSSDTHDLTEEISYRETVTSGQYVSIYSLRFSIEVEGGVLFGCFNSSAAYKDDWRPVVLQMLQHVEAL